jgi:hypothetical protein
MATLALSPLEAKLAAKKSKMAAGRVAEILYDFMIADLRSDLVSSWGQELFS